MKFETISGTLCLMTEPAPLTPDAKFPCVVRLIKNDITTIGLFQRFTYTNKSDHGDICIGLTEHKP